MFRLIPIAPPSLVMLGQSVGQKKKQRMNNWRDLGTREGGAAD